MIMGTTRTWQLATISLRKYPAHVQSLTTFLWSYNEYLLQLLQETLLKEITICIRILWQYYKNELKFLPLCLFR